MELDLSLEPAGGGRCRSPQTSWLVDLSRDEVTKLSREVGETTLLGIEIGDSIVYTFQAESVQSIRYTAKTGERRPIYPTSMGKLFLAAKDERALGAYFRAHAKLDRAKVTAELEQVRRDGVAFNREETVKGVTAAAAPIHSPEVDYRRGQRRWARLPGRGRATRHRSRRCRHGREAHQAGAKQSLC